jgi:hypothetical protein
VGHSEAGEWNTGGTKTSGSRREKSRSIGVRIRELRRSEVSARQRTVERSTLVRLGTSAHRVSRVGKSRLDIASREAAREVRPRTWE